MTLSPAAVRASTRRCGTLNTQTAPSRVALKQEVAFAAKSRATMGSSASASLPLPCANPHSRLQSRSSTLTVVIAAAATRASPSPLASSATGLSGGGNTAKALTLSLAGHKQLLTKLHVLQFHKFTSAGGPTATWTSSGEGGANARSAVFWELSALLEAGARHTSVASWPLPPYSLTEPSEKAAYVRGGAGCKLTGPRHPVRKRAEGRNDELPACGCETHRGRAAVGARRRRGQKQ